ncbi:hypothetical protein H8S37_04690 [Mediterraneibacter sp. NSJ-55]|uniref:Uncharacterized protein n=1 Tax=Mediterraneibacter hominis TaxID=2763054 RepID=A0A923LGJ3_9FIRM|nr:hypothetical protein [Mediterraneibacter hominis]MBC5688226.1 hypothetical protein [Mediterraneibacter hominis]
MQYNKINNIINSYKEEYKKFMLISTFPDFNIVIDDTLGANLKTTFDKGIPTFLLSSTYIPELKSNARPGVYHELTHILHDSTILTGLNKQQREPYIKWYTEYYATQVQMKAALGFNNYYENYKFQLSTKVNDWIYKKNVAEDIAYKTLDYKSTIQSFIKNKDIYHIILHSIYYLSQINFWNKYCKEDVSKLIDYEFISLLLGKHDIEILDGLLKNPEIDNFSYFSDLNSISNQISNKIIMKLNIL